MLKISKIFEFSKKGTPEFQFQGSWPGQAGPDKTRAGSILKILKFSKLKKLKRGHLDSKVWDLMPRPGSRAWLSRPGPYKQDHI